MPGTVLGTKDIALNKTDKNLCPQPETTTYLQNNSKVYHMLESGGCHGKDKVGKEECPVGEWMDGWVEILNKLWGSSLRRYL